MKWNHFQLSQRTLGKQLPFDVTVGSFNTE